LRFMAKLPLVIPTRWAANNIDPQRPSVIYTQVYNMSTNNPQISHSENQRVQPRMHANERG
jgi:hypothetical protein